MKISTLLPLCAVLLALPCRAEPEVRFTNQVVTFTNLQGIVYGNAELVRASADQLIFKTNDVFGTVPLTNLSRATLLFIGIPDSHLRAAADLRQQKANQVAQQRAAYADDQSRLSDPTNLVSLRVQAVLGTDFDPVYGPLSRCQFRAADNSASTAWVARLPDSVTNYFSQLAQLSNYVAQSDDQFAQLSAQVDAYTIQAQQQEQTARHAAQNVPQVVIAGDDSAYYNAMNPYVNNAAIAQANLDATKAALDSATTALQQQKSQLTKMHSDLEDLKAHEAEATTVSVLASHYLHYGNRILICAPKAELAK